MPACAAMTRAALCRLMYTPSGRRFWSHATGSARGFCLVGASDLLPPNVGGAPEANRSTSYPLIRTTELWTVVVSCGNH